MEKDTEPISEDAALARRLDIEERYPFYFSHKYDASASRRRYRDEFLTYVILKLLASAEWKRNYNDPDDMKMFWTSSELYVACHDIWVRSVAHQIDPLNGFVCGNLKGLRLKFLSLTVMPWNFLPTLHFRIYDGYDAPTEDRIVPFDIGDVEWILSQLIISKHVHQVDTPSNLHWSIAKDSLTLKLRSEWQKLTPQTVTIPAHTSQQEIYMQLKEFFKNMHAERIYLNTKHLPSIVHFGEFLAKGDIVWEKSQITEKPLEISTHGTLSDLDPSDELDQFTYGSTAINKALSPDEKSGRIFGMNYEGAYPTSNNYSDCWKFLMSRNDQSSILTGYQISSSPPEVLVPAPDILPDQESFMFCPARESTQDLIRCYLYLDPNYNQLIQDLPKQKRERYEQLLGKKIPAVWNWDI
jgi:hypothetical protein